MSATTNIAAPQPPQAVERLTYNKREAAAALGVSMTSIWRLEKQGLLRPIPGLRYKLFSVAAVRRFVESGES
jgi:DNA-binding XRE family transcriptional regulator